MRKNKGITLVSLVITVIVLAILASIATYSGINVIRSSKFTAFTAELKIMQTHVNAIYEENKDAEYGEVIENANLQVQEQAKKVFEASEIAEMNGYRYWSQDTIKNELKIEGVEQSFFVNLKKRSIVSCEGLEYEGETYYTLAQLPDGLYNVEYETPNAEAPTFDVKTEMIGDNKWRVTISNIQYNGYIGKWQVSYQLEGKNYWNTTEDLSFVVEEQGNYKIKLVNRGIQSEEESVQAGIKPGELVKKDNQKYINNGTAIIPSGFAIVPGCDDVSQGLVITDNVEDTEIATDKTKHIAKGNQFVWVPVLNMNNFVRIAGYYNNSLSAYNLIDYTEPFANGYSNEKEEYDDMYKNVSINKGFYIGRYEAGKDNNENVIIQKGANAYCNIPWGNSMEDIDGTTNTEGKKGAVRLSKDFSITKGYTNIVSTLCYGIQWDATMQFMDSNYISGNCNETSYVRNANQKGWFDNNYKSGNPNHKTGIDVDSNRSNCVKNIYDMAGNVWEWTMEANGSNYRVPRGGQYTNSAISASASNRGIGIANDFRSAGDLGFRIALYIQ